MSAAIVLVELGGERVETTEEGWKAEADRLHAKHGGVPSVTRVGAPPPEPVEEAPAAQPVSGVVNVQAAREVLEHRQGISEDGKARSEEDLATAVAAGFSPRKPLFARGTRVVALGVANARKSREEWEKMRPIAEQCEELVALIRQEDRQDVVVDVSTLAMRADGALVTQGQVFWPTYDTLTQLAARLGFGGGEYLRKCPPALRATNFNTWLDMVRLCEGPHFLCAPGKVLVFRSRKCSMPGQEGREIYGIVTRDYTAFDVDRVAPVVAQNLPSDARGEVKYDGTRAHWNVIYQTPVQPEDFVAGEFFRVGVRFATSDDGRGGLRGDALLWQNLCLNLLVIDHAKQPTLRKRHLDTEENLAEALRVGVAESLTKIDPFLRAWGYAREHKVTDDAIMQDKDLVGLPVSMVIPGIFNGILERELVRLPGRREDNVAMLVRAWEADTSADRGDTLAAVANAFTRAAHTEIEDPWVGVEVEWAAGQLLRGALRADGSEKAPTPLPYAPLGGKKGK